MAQSQKPRPGTVEAARRPTTAVVPQKKSMPALSPEWAKEMAEAAKDAVSTETPSMTNVSFRSGVLSVSGTPIPGNAMDCIVVGTAYERALYDGPFDPNKIKNPICFALTEDGEGGSPHPNSLYPQHPQCAGCPMDEWGSAGEGRRGKACKESRRLALIPADKIEEVADIAKSELAMAKIPVTSVKNWSNYVHMVSALHSMPYWGVTTKITLRPHIKNQFEVLLDLVETIEDTEALQALKQKRASVMPFVMAPYSMATAEGDKHPHTTQQPQPKGVPQKAAILSAPKIKKF